MSKAKLLIDDTDYRHSTGHSPRGRGSWAFVPYEKRRANNYLTFIVWVSGSNTYTEAKKQFKKLGYSGLWSVCT